MPFTANQIAALVCGEVVGDGTITLAGFSAAQSARPGDLTFADKEKHFASAEASPAAAILVSGAFNSSKKVLIRVGDARIAMAKLLPHFFPPDHHAPGIHPTAVVAASAKIDPSAHVGPYVVVGENVAIGARTTILSGTDIGHDCEIGDDAFLHPRVVIYPRCRIGHRVALHSGVVVGADGFGYVLDEGRHLKVQQVGNVIIHDDVEISANATVDRAALDSTVIGQGTKIDNLVHIAHNVKLGQHDIIMGQVGLAGSTEVGDYSVVASQSGIAGHLKIGNHVIIQAKSGIMRDVPDKSCILGVPAVPEKQAKRQWMALAKLPDLFRRVRTLEKSLGQPSENS
jgi:UDP-3-O-[3-hydroxymyristoyl] glucosamine N-acyltransferase